MTNRRGSRIGVLVPFTNTNLEPDMMMLAPLGVSLHFTRIGGYDEDEIPDENQMAGLGASSLDEPLHLLQGALMPDAVYELGLRADSPDADAIVLSCTDMRSVEVIDRLERTLGKPVVTSNQAMMFQSLQLLGATDPPSGFGKLFETLSA